MNAHCEHATRADGTRISTPADPRNEQSKLVLWVDGDSGPEAVSADAAVIVRVGDVNDNAPRIFVNTLLASDTDVAAVPEDARPETFVAHLLVADPDSGDNGRVDCSLDAAAGNHFRLKPMYGAEYQIVTSGEPLDRETTDRYLSQRIGVSALGRKRGSVRWPRQALLNNYDRIKVR